MATLAELLAAASQHYQAGRRDLAIDCLGQALRLGPNIPEAHNNLGVVLAEEGRRAEAAASFREAVRLKPDYAEAHNNLGNVLRELGSPEDAAGHFQKALRIRRDSADPHSKPAGLRPSLAELMRCHGTDKLFIHHYENEYERHFGPIRDDPITLLEIGVGGYADSSSGGGSLRVWRDYFPQGRIAGLDIETKDLPEEDRISIHRGSQGDPEFLVELSEQVGPFDVVIDDGSHVQSDIMTSFRTLFPRLKPGGIYVVEDLATSYSRQYAIGGKIVYTEGHPDPFRRDNSLPNTIDLIATLIDGMHWPLWAEPRVPHQYQKMVKSVHVSRELVFIYKL